MKFKFSQLYHQQLKKLISSVPKDKTFWPEEWTTVFYKTYPRFEKIKLPYLQNLKISLEDALKNRQSIRLFSSSKEKISLNDISDLLGYSAGITIIKPNGNYGRTYPSAGGRYPIETYIIALNGKSEIENGVYHYMPKEHALEILPHPIPEELLTLGDNFVKNAAMIVILTATFQRTQAKYDERGYKYILQESGHIGQNITLVSEALHLACCPLGGNHLYDAAIEKLLGIDGVTESIVYSFAIGKKDKHQ